MLPGEVGFIRRGKAQCLVGSEVASFEALIFKEAFFGNGAGAAPVRGRGLVLQTTLLCGKIVVWRSFCVAWGKLRGIQANNHIGTERLILAVCKVGAF